MFDRNLLKPMLSGSELQNELQILPEYDETIRTKDKSTRLIALSDLYGVYIPSEMSMEIYTKIYLSIVRSLNKKETIDAVKQSNENFRLIKQSGYKGILGGADSYTIIGCSGIGKSSAISRAVDLMTDKTFIEFNNTKVCPVMVVQCPFDSSVKGLIFEILRKIDLVLETKYYTNALRSHATTDILIGIISQVALNHIGLLIIDEIQNVATSKNGKIFIHSVTQLINNSGISICMVGTPECKVFFEQKLQLARRSMGLYYQPLEFNEYFTNFCGTMFDYQYTQKKTDLTEALIEWLYEHSGGLISVVVSLLHDAQEIAILSGYEKIDFKSLNDAYEKRTAMLHGYFKEIYITLPRTGKNQKKTDQATLEKLPTLENESVQSTVSHMTRDFSIAEILEESKRNGFKVVEMLKQYCKVEEISGDE